MKQKAAPASHYKKMECEGTLIEQAKQVGVVGAEEGGTAVVHPELLNAIATRTQDVLQAELANQKGGDFKSYEDKQEALLTQLLKAPGFGGNLGFEDLRDYLGAIYASVSKRLEEATSNDLKPGITKFLEQKPTSFEFYFEIGDARGFKDGHEIGHAKFIPFASLPGDVQKEVSAGWKYEYEGDKGRAKSYEEYEEARKEAWYLKTSTVSIGSAKAFEKALAPAKRAFNVASLFYLRGSHHSSREPEHAFKRWYAFGSSLRMASRYEFAYEEPLIRFDFLDEMIESASKVLKADPPTDFDEAIVSSFDVYGLISAQSPLYIRFLLTMIAIETLLMHGESPDAISSTLSERIAILLGDTPAWMIESFGIKREELTTAFVESHLVESRAKLQSSFKALYGKRSGAAHEGAEPRGRTVEEEDYRNANMLFRFALEMLFQLKEKKGLDRIAKDDRRDGKSLAEWVDSCKFSFAKVSPA